MSPPRPWIRLHPDDNLLVALQPLPTHTTVELPDGPLTLRQAVPAKHKVTTEAVSTGGPVYLYGVLVGKATVDLPAGSLVTTANVCHATRAYGRHEPTTAWVPPDVTRFNDRTFQGHARSDGQVGTANYWLIIPLVFCENRNVAVLREALLEPLGYTSPRTSAPDIQHLIQAYQGGGDAGAILRAKAVFAGTHPQAPRVFPNVDGIKFLTHEGGCGGTRDDARALCALLAGYVCNPNVGGATLLSLGCQNAQVGMFREALAARSPNFDKPLRILEQQGVVEREGGGSEGGFIDRCLRETFTGLMEANRSARTPHPLSKLVLGLECGGSDGFSGISANPVLGHAVDLLVALGGSALLAEFPELNGVEQELIDRCATPALADKFSRLMRTYARAAEAVGSGFSENPSPGNLRDGLITDAMKSAGAARKGGSSPIVGVLDYTAPVSAPGLNLLCTPGNDVESTTALAGSGANLIAFTTGLGTPTGNPVAPVVKVSSNNALAVRMADLIDFNAGPVITGEATIEAAGEQLLELLIEVASGTRLTAAQRLGQDDFIPWKRGISL